MPGGATHERAQAGEHLLHVKWLGDVIIRAGVESTNLVAPPVARRQQQDRHLATGLAPFLKNADAILAGQADVEHDGVIGFGVAKKPALLAIEGAIDRVARLFKRRHELPIQILVVLDHQQAQGKPPYYSPFLPTIRPSSARM